jgi:hypothetical protein
VTAWLRAYWSKLVSGLAVTAVAGVTGVVSYSYIYELTLTLHQTVMVARLMPFGVDGLIVVGSVVLMQSIPGQRWLVWVGVGPGVAISLFANVESGIRYGWLAAAWAGIPAVAFSMATFTLNAGWLGRRRGRRGHEHRGRAVQRLLGAAPQTAASVSYDSSARQPSG